MEPPLCPLAMYSMECTYLCTLHNRLEPTCICISYLNLCICVWSIAMYLMGCIYILYWFCTLHIMEWSPAVFSFHPICSTQIDLSMPSNQCCQASILWNHLPPTQPPWWNHAQIDPMLSFPHQFNSLYIYLSAHKFYIEWCLWEKNREIFVAVKKVWIEWDGRQ